MTEASKKELKDGEPCDHPGCLNHVTHPCEGCGRIAGKNIKKEIEELQAIYERLWREMIAIEGEIIQKRCKLNALSPEECAGITKLIGSNLPDYKPTGE